MAAALTVGGSQMFSQVPPPPAPGRPVGLADIKMLAKTGISDEIILSQIRNAHVVFHLTTAEILDLKQSGVSEKVIDFMINTPETVGSWAAAPPSSSGTVVEEAVAVSQPPPPPVVEEVVPAPGPDYVWIVGSWGWYGGRWVWVRGHWAVPPRRGAVWVASRWEQHRGRGVWIEGHWR